MNLANFLSLVLTSMYKPVFAMMVLLICLPTEVFSATFLGETAGSPPARQTSSFSGKIPDLRAPLPRGLVVPFQEAQLSSLMDGQIQRIHKQEGERFKKGEMLISFFCPIRRARVQQAQALLNAGNKRLKVNQELVTVRAASHLDVALIEAEVIQAKAELTVQKAMFKMCQIRAPFSGRVNSVQIHAHESVSQGQPLMDIASEGTFEVRVIVPSHRYASLHIGTDFSIHLKETGRSYPVQIIRIGGHIDPVSQTVPILGRIKGEFPELIPGMGGPVTFRNPTP